MGARNSSWHKIFKMSLGLCSTLHAKESDEQNRYGFSLSAIQFLTYKYSAGGLPYSNMIRGSYNTQIVLITNVETP